MQRKTFLTLLILVLLLAPLNAAQRKKADQISGDWNATLSTDTNSFVLTLKLKRDGNKVSGTYESAHIGKGDISQGAWTANQLRLTLESGHGAIVLTGGLKQGKLSGNFDAGAMQGTWEASRK